MNLPTFLSLSLLASAALGFGPALAADAAKGKALYEKCIACHTLDAGKNEVGPHLVKIMGRKAAAVEEFRYSAAMRRSNVTWDEATLDTFLADPQGFIKGNRMPFAGVPAKGDRDDIIAYLKDAAK
jgi:cytochrome c2